jgi:polyribonucleotide nucleotidyltransferase
MIDNKLSTNAKILDILVNMNKAIVKQKLENYGLADEVKSIKITGHQVHKLIGPNNASVSKGYEINDIQLKKPRNLFKTKLRKNSRVEVMQ